MARPQQNWGQQGLLTLLTRWASIWTMPNTASPKSEPPCGRAVYTPLRATILGHPPQKTAPGGGGGGGGGGGEVFLIHSHVTTRQIWGIWKLRPAYSPETPNFGQNRWCFVLCDLEILWMTLENNKASLLCCFQLCVTFHSHRWIQTGVTVRKRPIWVKFNDF